MQTALDRPTDALDAQERRFVEQVREHGWFGTHVFDGEGTAPCFSYTTGLWLKHGFPEVIVFGLPRDVAHDIFWDVFRDLEDGKSPPVGAPASDVLANLDVVFVRAAKRHYREHLGWSLWFYGGDGFPSLQLVWPDRAGVFPWQPDFDPAFQDIQPDLSEEGWSSAVAAL